MNTPALLPVDTLYQVLLETLDLDDSPGWVSSDQVAYHPSRSRILDQAHKLKVDGVYFVDNVPVIYFRRFSESDPQAIRKLHQDVWNQGQVPFLYVITPGQIRLYNGYALPARDVEHLDEQHRLLTKLSNGLDHLVSVEDARSKIERTLRMFRREWIDTGSIWQDDYVVDTIKATTQTRVDQRLLRNLREARIRLLDSGLVAHTVHSLLTCSLLVMYLQDRNAMPDDCLPAGQQDFLDILHDPAVTFGLFEALSQRFNGKVFPKGPMPDVTAEHLETLRRFLSGDELRHEQASLFRLYNFGHIPIEMISSLYQEFLEEKQGAHYTPLALVRLLLDETWKWERPYTTLRALDPACGSGIFLVELYHRLIEQWRCAHPGQVLDAEVLQQIMTSCIHGIDIDPDAIHVTAFSLYLAMLDYLEPEHIRRSFRKFPVLDENLFAADYFDRTASFNGTRYDLVIGNPPWESKLTDLAEDYCRQHGYPVSDQQIAQAFMWRAPEFCDPDGSICLLVSSKAVLFNQSSQKFRREFFARFEIQGVLNLSALRHESNVMFAHAIAPAAALFYRATSPASDNSLFYIVPKPSLRSRQMGIPVLDASEVKWLPQQLVLQQDTIWKVAAWGTTRDWQLIEHLTRLPRLKDFLIEYGRAKPQEGYQVGRRNPKRHPELVGWPSIDASAKVRYVIGETEPFKHERFYSVKNLAIYEPPLVIIHQSPIQGEVCAAFSESRLVYPEKFAGFPGEPTAIPYLKLLTLYLNSSLATYYYFMTAAKWGIERDDLQLHEHMALPFIQPDLPDLQQPGSIFSRLLAHFDRIAHLRRTGSDPLRYQEGKLRQEVDELLFELYELTQSERDLVLDAVRYTIQFFQHPTSSEAVRTPRPDELVSYCEVFRSSFESVSARGGIVLNSWVYPPSPGLPLSVVAFESTTAPSSPVQMLERSADIPALLRTLDQRQTQTRVPDQTLYVRRHARVYDGDTLFVVKPAELRLWTRSMARSDADEAIAELLAEHHYRHIEGASA